jgi:hypothetical protein
MVEDIIEVAQRWCRQTGSVFSCNVLLTDAINDNCCAVFTKDMGITNNIHTTHITVMLRVNYEWVASGFAIATFQEPMCAKERFAALTAKAKQALDDAYSNAMIGR